MRKCSCPCCGGRDTVEEDMLGMYGICSVCGWEDDLVQRKYPNEFGANMGWTLNAARKAWAAGETLFERYPNPNGKK